MFWLYLKAFFNSQAHFSWPFFMARLARQGKGDYKTLMDWAELNAIPPTRFQDSMAAQMPRTDVLLWLTLAE
jgi:hypothetical protein